MLPLDGLDRELRYPAGTWFRPPKVGRYRYWIEGQGWISPYSGLLNSADQKFHDIGLMTIAEIAPAGTVAMAEPLPSHLQLRLLSTSAIILEEFLHYEMSRRLDPERAERGVPMPAGSVLAALRDTETGEYTALSRPVRVAAGERTLVEPAPPPRSRASSDVRARPSG